MRSLSGRWLLFHSLVITSSCLPGIGWARNQPAPDVVKYQAQIDDSDRANFGEGRAGSAQLINLNPSIGSWWILNVKWPNETNSVIYHIENPYPESVQFKLSSAGFQISSKEGVTTCDLFEVNSSSYLKKAASANVGFSPLCGGKLSLRKNASGSAGGWKEGTANFLRNNFGRWGEYAVDSYKSFRSVRGASGELGGQVGNQEKSSGDGQPNPALINLSFAQKSMTVPNLHLALAEKKDGKVVPGSWYPLQNQEGVYFSAMTANMADASILSSSPERVKNFDDVEGGSLAYLVAFDLSQFEIGWSHGTDLPGVGWTDRNETGRTSGPAKGMPGPDGFAKLNPLGMSGSLNPVYLSRLVATMCGGFQRKQAAFRPEVQPFGANNYGSYYGFLQEGVLMSTLNQGLATFIVYKDGRVEIKTWRDEDNTHLSQMRFVRQNGVPIIDRDSQGRGIPGAQVYSQGLGNWSGTGQIDDRAGGLFRSERAAACIANRDGRQFMIYGYFSAATPKAMARVFQAYQCEYAIHLDMNSPDQAYLGLFSKSGDKYTVEHPVSQMVHRDTSITFGDQKVPAPRYVGTPDQADFFYILRK